MNKFLTTNHSLRMQANFHQNNQIFSQNIQSNSQTINNPKITQNLQQFNQLTSQHSPRISPPDSHFAVPNQGFATPQPPNRTAQAQFARKLRLANPKIQHHHQPSQNSQNSQIVSPTKVSWHHRDHPYGWHIYVVNCNMGDFVA